MLNKSGITVGIRLLLLGTVPQEGFDRCRQSGARLHLQSWLYLRRAVPFGVVFFLVPRSKFGTIVLRRLFPNLG